MSSHTAFRAVLLASVLSFGSMGAQAAASNSFDLTDQWTVSPANVSGSHDPQASMPCILSNQYDNGFKIRFTGGQDQILMMAVDFKQNIFTPGQAYATAISVGSMTSASSGKAFDTSTLLFNVRDLDGFTKAMKSAQNMTLNVQGNPMQFALGQVQPALERMNACAVKEQSKVVTADAQPVAIKPEPIVVEAKVKDLAPAVNAENDKEREIYVRRRVKPMEMSAEQKVAAVETASGDNALQVAEVRHPEPIDLLKKSEPQKAIAIEPVQSSIDDAPVLVSRRDESMSLQMPAQEARPQKMALFDAQEKKQNAQQKPLEPIIQSEIIPVKKPAVPIQQKVAENAAPVVAPQQKPVQIAAANSIKNDDFLQQSLRGAEEEIQKASTQVHSKTSRSLPAAKAYEPITTPEPYDAIKAEIPAEPKKEIAAVAMSKSIEAPSNVASIEKPQNILSPGIKVLEPQPVALVHQKQISPEWSAPKDVAKRSKKSEMPAIEDVLDAQEEAIIPIRTVRSKDIFVSRTVVEDEVKVESKPVQVEPKVVRSQPWDAKSGEDVKIVLARWAERAGTDLVWEADRGGKLAKDVRVNGSFEEAVQTLMAQNGEALGLNGAFDGSMQGAQSQAPVSLISTQKMIEHGQSDKSTLRPFLENLSKQQDFKLVWNAQRDFVLKAPVNPTGQFEDVLRTALEQYNTDQIRPVGQLNINPETGERILVIDSERSL